MSEKLELTLENATRSGSPVPSFNVAPILIG
jgi:hypothetical protein